jgi:hypothetical protein
MNFVLKQGDCLLVFGHHAGRAAIAGGRRDRSLRNFGKPSNFFDSVKLHVSRAAARIRPMRIPIDPKLIVRERSDP